MLKAFLLSALIAITSFVGASPAVLATAASDDLQSVCQTSPNSSLCTGYNKGEDAQVGDNTVLKLLKRITNILFFAAGVLAVFMVIYGGFKYITSAGEAQKAANGRQTLVFALIGLVVVVVSRQLLLFVLDKLLK